MDALASKHSILRFTPELNHIPTYILWNNIKAIKQMVCVEN